MQSLEHIYETRLTDDGLYEVTELECQDSMEHDAVWLNDELASERERGVRLLEIMDDFDRALLNPGEAPDEVVNGFRLIYQRFSDVLHANDVTRFDIEGELFDPTVESSTA